MWRERWGGWRPHATLLRFKEGRAGLFLRRTMASALGVYDILDLSLHPNDSLAKKSSRVVNTSRKMS